MRPEFSWTPRSIMLMEEKRKFKQREDVGDLNRGYVKDQYLGLEQIDKIFSYNCRVKNENGQPKYVESINVCQVPDL